MTTCQIELPEDIVKRFESRVEKTNFDNVDEYIAFILKKIDNNLDEPTEEPTTVSEEEVENRLESLGYL